MKALLACLAVLALPAHAEPYLRIRDAAGGTRILEIAERRFRLPAHPESRLRLLGVAHIGSEAYYREIQTRLDKADRVLFEGVGGDEKAFRKPDPGGPMADGAQARLARALGLEFQLFAVRYDRKHFVNSDLSPRELMALFSGEDTEELMPDGQRRMLELMATMEGTGLAGQLLPVLLGGIESRPAYARAATWALVEILGKLPADISKLQGMPPDLKELMTVLIQRRNDRVLEDVARELSGPNPPRDLVIFYGAAHMHDLEERLREQHGLEAGETVWLPALRGNLRASGLSMVEKRMFQGLVNQQLRTIQQMTGPQTDATPPAPPEAQ